MGSRIDPVIMVPALVAIVSMAVVSMSDRHILPQTSSTFSLQAVHGFKMTDKNKDAFLSKAEYVKTDFYTNKISPVTAVKYNKGCYGSSTLKSIADDIPATSTNGNMEFMYQYTLNKLQRDEGGGNLASVCRCIDEYSARAFPLMESSQHTLVSQGFDEKYPNPASEEHKALNMEYEYRAVVTVVPRTAAQQTNYDNLFAPLKTHEQFAGNFLYDLPTADYAHLTEIVEWCEQTALPQYTVKFESVIYSKALLLLALALVFAGLDVFGLRIKLCETGAADPKDTWRMLALLIEVLPVVGYAYLWWDKQWQGHIQDSHALDVASKTTFLVMLVSLMVGTTVLLIFGVGVWTTIAGTDTSAWRSSNRMLQRIITDVPMIVGLAVLGVALKLQNAEHDERILLSTLLVLTTAGLVQHMSSLVKIMYESICAKLSDDVLEKLQAPKAADTNGNNVAHAQLTRTREILQYFGWTRLYGFFVILLFVAISVTMSSSVAAVNPLNAFTQNQYYYFVFAFIVAWTGLDFIYEILPFTSNEPDNYSEYSVERMRKISILVYIIFVMISQYTFESGEF